MGIEDWGFWKGIFLSGGLSFEAEYLNGEKNDQGKIYWNNGQVSYEGEFLNDKMNVFGKQCDPYC